MWVDIDDVRKEIKKLGARRSRECSMKWKKTIGGKKRNIAEV